MIRSVLLTRDQTNGTILQVQYGSPENMYVGYKKMTKLELLNLVATATQFLSEDEVENQLSRG